MGLLSFTVNEASAKKREKGFEISTFNCRKIENNVNERQFIFKLDLITHKLLLPLLKDQN